MPTESQLDDALADALANVPAFAAWFLAKTRFAAEGGVCVDVRSDNPWSRVAFEATNPETGITEHHRKDRETDVLAVFATPSGRRIALHIENKIADGAFTPGQPESYRARLEQWRFRPRLGNYADAACVLVAPQVFYENNRAASGLFDTFISHEELAQYLPIFAQPKGAA